QQPQQSSQQQHAQLQHQQHGQAQAQQVQSTPSPGQPNGSIGAFHSFTPSDQLGNEFAYFQSQRSTPSQPPTTQQNVFDADNLVWASPIVGKPNGDPQQQQQLHAQQQAQF